MRGTFSFKENVPFQVEKTETGGRTEESHEMSELRLP